MSEEKYLADAAVEKYFPYFWMSVVLVLLAGIVAGCITSDKHWVDKSGKVIVAVSLVLTYLQFQYEARYADQLGAVSERIAAILDDKGILADERHSVVLKSAQVMKLRYENTRRKVLLRALATAGMGELVAAFGGDLFEVARFFLAIPHSAH